MERWGKSPKIANIVRTVWRRKDWDVRNGILTRDMHPGCANQQNIAAGKPGIARRSGRARTWSLC